MIACVTAPALGSLALARIASSRTLGPVYRRSKPPCPNGCMNMDPSTSSTAPAQRSESAAQAHAQPDRTHVHPGSATDSLLVPKPPTFCRSPSHTLLTSSPSGPAPRSRSAPSCHNLAGIVVQPHDTPSIGSDGWLPMCKSESVSRISTLVAAERRPAHISPGGAAWLGRCEKIRPSEKFLPVVSSL